MESINQIKENNLTVVKAGKNERIVILPNDIGGKNSKGRLHRFTLNFK